MLCKWQQWSLCIVFYLWSEILQLSACLAQRQIPLPIIYFNSEISMTVFLSSIWKYFSVNKYLLNMYCVPGTVLDSVDTKMKACMKLGLHWEKWAEMHIVGDLPWDWSYYSQRALGAEKGHTGTEMSGRSPWEGAILTILMAVHLRLWDLNYGIIQLMFYFSCVI